MPEQEKSTKLFIQSTLTFLVYFLVAKLSLGFAVINSLTSPVWPPTGIAFAAFVLFGPRIWPAIYFGSVLANITSGSPVLAAIIIGAGNTLEGAAGGYLMNRFAGGIHAFDRAKTVFYTIIAAIFAPMISATVGVTAISLTGLSPWAAYLHTWSTWWLGNVTGAIVITPLIILWFDHTRVHLRERWPELLVVVALFAFVVYVVFSGLLPFPYLLMAALLWVAFRFGPRDTATAVFLIGIIGVWATSRGYGPFYLRYTGKNEAFLFLQLFLAIVSIAKLTVAALVGEITTAQNTIEQREKRFRSLIEKSRDAVLLMDPMANILYASSSTKQILGYSPAEFEGMSGLSVIHPDDLDRTVLALSDVSAEDRKSKHIELRIRMKNGKFAWIGATLTNLLRDPNVGAIVLNYRDVTERKNLETAKDDFMMISAHQLRSPLSAMRWNMELLLMTAKDIPAKVKTKLRLIYDYNQKMIDLVNELLDISRIIQGKISSEPELTDISALIRKEIEIETPFAREQKVTLKSNIRGYSMPDVSVDPKRFLWVIQNLLSNAIKYTPSGGTVTVSVAVVGREVCVTITDTGIGIPVEEQQFVFTKFFRASNAVAVHAEGTGLGLYAAKEYIEHWGGTITMESPAARGKGTKFTISIPIKKRR